MSRSRRPARTPSKLSQSLQRQLNTYALAASAVGVGVLALPQPAAAKIVYTPANVVISPTINNMYTLDLNHDGKGDFVFVAFSNTDGYGHFNGGLGVEPAQQGNGVWQKIRTFGTSGNSYAVAMSPGVQVGPKRNFGPQGFAVMCAYRPSYGRNGGLWCNIRKRYLGFKFIINGKTHFGWARLDAKDYDAVLTGYAYETIPNKPIIAGKTKSSDEIENSVEPNPASPGSGASKINSVPDIPKSATLGVLAMGEPGLSIWRGRELVGATQ